MNRLTTQGSREVSPLSNMVPSQDSSPPVMFNSPSPSAALDFAGLAPTGGRPAAHSLFAFDLNNTPAHQAGVGPAPLHIPMPMQVPVAQFPYRQAYGAPPYSLKIEPTPLKSRVETQIPIKMRLSPLPPGIRRLHLPRHTISKPKLLAKPPPERSPDMLELHTVLVCTSAMQNTAQRERACQRARDAAQAPGTDSRAEEMSDDEESKSQNGGEVHICVGCVTRERKRAARKKVKKPEDEQLWLKDESRRVIVFNTHEIKEWQQLNVHDLGPKSAEFQVDAPMRIACYCRHHSEKSGFQVIFTITDFHRNVIAQAFSNSIMITDDHKTHTLPPNAAGSSADGSDATLTPSGPNQAQDANALSPPGGSVRLSHSSSDLQTLKRNVSMTFPPSVATPGLSQATSAVTTPRNLSRPASPTGLNGPSCKKRKASGSAKVPSGLAMTRLETSHPSAAQSPSQQVGALLPKTTSPFSPSLTSFPSATEPMFGQTPLATFSTGPPTPNSNDQMLFGDGNRSGSLDNLAVAQAQMYSAPASSHPSRAPSPSGMRAHTAALQQQQRQQQQNSQFAQALATSLYTLPMGIGSPRPPSIIHKIIPAEGPKSGGIEVTILGSGFHQGLEVMFGEIRATTTTYWGESSLVCLLPPSPHSGSVLVTLKHQNAPPSQQFSTKQPIFKYVDDDEQQLMRTALSVLGHKMNGSFEDVSEVARRIIGDVNSQWGASSSAPAGQRTGGAPFTTFDANFEAKLLKVLELIDLDDSTHKPRLNLRRSTGQTMLHLACSLGLHRFVAGLLARGTNPDLRDKGGYTPLHVASLNNHPEIVRRLISYGADPTIRTLSGLTAADVARSREVIRAIRRVERHARSRSSGSLHSRASSMTSLKSLWEPPSTAQPASGQTSSEESETGEESPEYSSEDVASEKDPDVDDGPWLDMRRRRSAGAPRSPDNNPTVLLQPSQADVPGGMGSPTAAVTAFKEQFAAQFQQIQQAMALHIQNLPQFPYLPQMPHMPPLADYQAYLNSAAVFQRLTSMVPNIGGSRPGSAGEQPASKGLDGRRWDISSLMSGAATAPPPAYEEIFPQSDMDTKQASAAQAAAEAEADHKCATLYDQPSTSMASTETRRKLPALLQIGRKNAITREQQENLRRAHAEKLKRLSRDRNLFFIWVSFSQVSVFIADVQYSSPPETVHMLTFTAQIPLLIVVLFAMLYGRFPGLFTAAWNTLPTFGKQVAAADTIAETVAETVEDTVRDRIVEVL